MNLKKMIKEAKHISTSSTSKVSYKQAAKFINEAMEECFNNPNGSFFGIPNDPNKIFIRKLKD